MLNLTILWSFWKHPRRSWDWPPWLVEWSSWRWVEWNPSWVCFHHFYHRPWKNQHSWAQQKSRMVATCCSLSKPFFFFPGFIHFADHQSWARRKTPRMWSKKDCWAPGPSGDKFARVLSHDGQIWRFPEMGVPPVIIYWNGIFHEINHPAMGYPHDEPISSQDHGFESHWRQRPMKLDKSGKAAKAVKADNASISQGISGMFTLVIASI